MCTGEGGNAGVHDGQSVLPQDHRIIFIIIITASASDHDLRHHNLRLMLIILIMMVIILIMRMIFTKVIKILNDSDADDDLDEDCGV